MPSIRKRLKKLTSSKKSKSTSDLDNMGEPGSQSVGDDDTRSYISEAASERTDVSLNESTYSYASHTEDGKKKKKRKLKISLSKKKKKDLLVKDPSGAVVFRSLSVEHDPRVFQPQNENMSGDESLLKPENVELSKSVGSNVGRDDSSEADEWRMSGLLETVNRTSNTSLNDNLISTFEERRQMLSEKAIAESTPVKDNTAEAAAPLEGDEIDNKGRKIKTYLMPSHVVEVSFSPHGKHRTETDQDIEVTCKQDKHLLPEDEAGYSDDDSLVGFRRDLEPVQEEDFTEMRNVDPECEIDIDGPLVEGDSTKEMNGISEESSKEVEKDKGDRYVKILDERSVVCDTGRGKRVIIRHLEEVASKANLELSETVNMEDWLVLNIEKDDWVVVGYTKVGGEITNLFEQSVDTI